MAFRGNTFWLAGTSSDGLALGSGPQICRGRGRHRSGTQSLLRDCATEAWMKCTIEAFAAVKYVRRGGHCADVRLADYPLIRGSSMLCCKVYSSTEYHRCSNGLAQL
mmetsp:Transcript_94470/g.181473  ORF Transcript_94470/g.181473 Transcript_94470/m.181473 type:complete len:107 (-) Transcript_94470:229-549(-)